MQYQILKITFFFFILMNSSFAQNIHSNGKLNSVVNYNKEFYFAKSTKGQWGLRKANTKYIIKATYDTLFSLCNIKFDAESYTTTSYKTGYIIGKKNNQYELLNLKGEVTLTVDGLMPRWMNGVVLVRIGKEWGLAKTSGEYLLPVSCKEIEWRGDILALNDGDGWLLFDPKKGDFIQEGTL